jgi:acylphosphatase
VLKGRVQDVSLRSRIISTARIYNLSGYPPINDIDGSVKMICEGPEEFIQKFLKDIEIREELPSGIRVEELEKKEIPIDFPLPSRFAAMEVEELSNISRKLDIGNESLKEIKGTLNKNTELLGSVDSRLGGMDEKLGSMDNRLGSVDSRLGGMDEKLGSIDTRLGNMDASLPERIAQALKNILEKKS